MGALGWSFSSWVQHLDQPAADSFEEVDAIVTLAGGTGRMAAGLELLSDERADLLLLSGTHRDAKLTDIFPDLDPTTIPPDSVILLESRSTSTYENAIEAWAVLVSRQKIGSIALITSNYHMRRAELVFTDVFPDDVEIYSIPVTDPDTEPGRWWRTSRGRRLVVKEYFKFLVYRLRF